jgi:putative flippase GtrA
MRKMLAAGSGGASKFLGSALSGAAATAVDVGTLVLMVRHGTPIALAAFVACAAGAVVCFTLNKYIAFRDRSRITWQQVGRFGLVAVATALLMALAMEVIAVQLGVPYLLAKVICAIAVFAAWSYPAQRRLVFAAEAARSLS